MTFKLESRAKIAEGVDQRGRTLKERLSRMGLVVGEMKVVCQASKLFRSRGTCEGVEEVQRAIKQAREAGVREYAQQNAVLEKNMSECQSAADDLENRCEAARKNTAVFRSAGDHMKEVGAAKHHMVCGERGAKHDMDYLGNDAKRQTAATDTARQTRDKQRQTLQTTVLNAAPFLRPTARGQDSQAGELRGNYGPAVATGERYRQQLSKIGGPRETCTQRSTESEIPPEELERLQGMRPVPKDGTESEPLEEKYATKPKPYDVGPKEYIVRAHYQQGTDEE